MLSRTFLRNIVAFLLVALSVSCAQVSNEETPPEKPRYRNIIFMVPDGCSQSIQTLARWCKGSDLQLDGMNAGVVRTYMANSVITGSAAAASAFACGHKTTARFLGVRPRGNDLLSTFTDYDPERAYAPMASILEMAKTRGKATGIVATSSVTHATPAAFGCHVADRGWNDDIMENLVYNGVTVVMGGGRRYLLPKAKHGKRADGENLEQVLHDRGYTMVTNREEMNAVAPGADTKLWGAFASNHMSAEIDRPFNRPDEPTLSEMTAKAIQVLSHDPDGFFLMVEGSQVDWAAHDNDIAAMLADFMEFDRAVKVAVDFAKADGETLVVAFPDHNTGGLKLGQYHQPTGYTSTKVDDLVGPILGMSVSAGKLVREIGKDTSDANMTAQIKAYWGFDVTPEVLADVRTLAAKVGMKRALARVIAQKYTTVGWTTHGHCGEDVPLWRFPRGEAAGAILNSDIPSAVSNWQTTEGPNTLDELTARLFVEAEKAFPGEWTIDRTDPKNPVLVVRDHFRMPLGKDLLIDGDKETRLGSLVIYAPLRDGDKSDGSIHTVVKERAYIPQTAIARIRAASGGK